MCRAALSMVVSAMEQVTNMPTPIGGENAPRPIAMIITMPYWIGSMPNVATIGSNNGPKISNAGRPSSNAPMHTSVTMVATMNSHAEPCSTVNSEAMPCGTLASVSDHDSVLAVLVMNRTI